MAATVFTILILPSIAPLMHDIFLLLLLLLLLQLQLQLPLPLYIFMISGALPNAWLLGYH